METVSAQFPENPDHEAIVAGWIEILRPVLMVYVRSVLPMSDACDDIVQETCLFLWEKRQEFTPDTNFKAWAFKVAWFKILSHRRDLQRQRVFAFSEDVLQRIAGAAEEMLAETGEVEGRMEALRACLEEVSAEDLELLKLKYERGESLTGHARARGWKPNRLQKTLSRLRMVLRHCVESRLSRNP